MVRLVDVIDTANLLTKYDEYEVEYDNKKHEYLMDDSDFEDLLSRVRNKDYVLQFVVNPKSGRSKFTRMSSGSQDVVMSAEDDEDIFAEELLLTSSALISLLSKIEELQDYDLGIISENEYLELQVGDSFYRIESASELDEVSIEVEPEVFEYVEDLNEDVYDELIDSGELEGEELDTVESGILKEALKTLAIGGLVRLGKKYLTSDKA